MPVSAQAMSASIMGQFSAVGFKGKNDKDIADAVSTAIANYIILPNLATCSLNGTAGPTGTINSIAVLGLIPKTMGTLMGTAGRSKRLRGKDMNTFFSAIGTGVGLHLLSMRLQGTAVGIGPGGGTASFKALVEKTLEGLIFAQLQARQIKGKNAKDVASSVAKGFVQHMKTSRFTVVSAGAVAPVPPAGPVAVTQIPSLFTKII